MLYATGTASSTINPYAPPMPSEAMMDGSVHSAAVANSSKAANSAPKARSGSARQPSATVASAASNPPPRPLTTRTAAKDSKPVTIGLATLAATIRARPHQQTLRQFIRRMSAATANVPTVYPKRSADAISPACCSVSPRSVTIAPISRGIT